MEFKEDDIETCELIFKDWIDAEAKSREKIVESLPLEKQRQYYSGKLKLIKSPQQKLQDIGITTWRELAAEYIKITKKESSLSRTLRDLVSITQLEMMRRLNLYNAKTEEA